MPWSSLPLGALSEDQVRPWLLPPVWDRLVAGQGRYLADLRPGVALFLRFGGLDYDEDDAAGEKLDKYLRWVQEVLARYEGYMFQLTLGDKGCYLYGVYGAPLAHDDDPARAVAAALELQALPPEIDFVTGLQMGISQGRMRAGAYGGSARGTYGVLGDEVNIAARLMGKAESGQILVSQHIAEAVSKSYRIEHMGLIEVKGKQQPLPASQVLGRRRASQQRPAMSYAYRLVGRENELAQMEHLLESVLTGKGRILRLEGAAGVGKSHLAAEFIERAVRHGFRVALGGCQSISQDIAYYPWRQAFGALLGLGDEQAEGPGPEAVEARQMAQLEAALREVSPGWLLRLPLLGDLLDLPIPDNEITAAFDPRLRQEALFALAVEIVQTWAREQPLLLLIEDVHWMDEASLGLALALGRTVASAPVLLALVHRPPIREDRPLLPELVQLPIYDHLNLDELSSEGVAMLVSHRLEGQLAPLALDLIQVQAHGNPFFAEELVSALRESGQLHRDEDGMWGLSDTMVEVLRAANCLTRENGQWVLAKDAQLSAAELGIPDSIHGIVLSRLDRLPEAHKLTLKAASVIGRVFEFDVLEQAHPVRPGRVALGEQMTALEARDFARLEIPPPRLAYMFKHNTTQEVAYETLLEEQRRELHQAVGEVLESLQPEAVERLAHHYSHSGVRDKTIFYLDKAAFKAQAEYANETALNYFNQALALEARWEWREGKVKLLHILGQREEERTGLVEMEAMPELSVRQVGEVAYLWGQYYEAVSDYEQAQTAVERALSASRERADPVSEINSLAYLGLIARRQADFERAKGWHRQALTLFEADRAYAPEEARAFAQALHEMGMVQRQLGDFDGARTHLEQALTLNRQSGNRKGEAEVLNGLGLTAHYQRDFAEALNCYRQAVGISQSIGDRATEAWFLQNLGMVIGETGDYGQAIEHLSRALSISQATGDRWAEASAWNALGILYQELGDLERARGYLSQGLELSGDIGDESNQAYLLANLGLVALDQGDLQAADRLLNDGLVLAQNQDDKHLSGIFANYLGSLHLRLGNVERAIEEASVALAIRQEAGSRLYTTDDLAILAAAYLTAGDRDKALSYAQEVLALLDECQGEGPEFPQQDYYVCYQVLQANGQTQAAYDALRSAHRLVMARAESITDPVLRHSFLEKVPINRQILKEYADLDPSRDT
jgi:predicted ATPase/class 3 adenylate cyclase